MSNKNVLDDFQEQVSQLLIRHRSVLDVISKTQEASARVNRALTKAITECGCVTVNAQKQPYDPSKSINDHSQHLNTHFHGNLCENCRDILTAELGKNLFYLSALCNISHVKLSEVLKTESEKLNTLGIFNLS